MVGFKIILTLTSVATRYQCRRNGRQPVCYRGRFWTERLNFQLLSFSTITGKILEYINIIEKVKILQKVQYALWIVTASFNKTAESRKKMNIIWNVAIDDWNKK